MPFSDTFLNLLKKYPPTKREQPLSNAQVVNALKSDSLKYSQIIQAARRIAKRKAKVPNPSYHGKSETPINSDFSSCLAKSIKQYEQYKCLVSGLMSCIKGTLPKDGKAELKRIMSELFNLVFDLKMPVRISNRYLTIARAYYTKYCRYDQNRFFLCIEIFLYCKATNITLFNFAHPSMHANIKNTTVTTYIGNEKASDRHKIHNAKASPHVSIVPGITASTPRQTTTFTVEKDKAHHPSGMPAAKASVPVAGNMPLAIHNQADMAKEANIPQRQRRYKLNKIVPFSEYLNTKSETGHRKLKKLQEARRICVVEEKMQWCGVTLSRGALYGFWPRLCRREIIANGKSILGVYTSNAYTWVQYGWFSYGETRKKDGHIQVKIWRPSKASLYTIRKHGCLMLKDLVWQAYWMRIDQHRIAFDLYVWLKLPLYKIKLGTYGTHADKCLLCDNKTHAGTAYCQYHLREQGWILK